MFNSLCFFFCAPMWVKVKKYEFGANFLMFEGFLYEGSGDFELTDTCNAFCLLFALSYFIICLNNFGPFIKFLEKTKHPNFYMKLISCIFFSF